MVSYTCPQCGFILIASDEPDEVCPECGYARAEARLAESLLSAGDPSAELPSAPDAAPPGAEVHRSWRPFIRGLVVGVLLSLAAAAVFVPQGQPWNPRSRSPVASTVLQGELEEVRQLLARNRAEAARALATVQAERDAAAERMLRAEKSQSQLDVQVRSQQSVHTETLDILRATQSERDDLRARLAELDEELEALRLSGGASFLRNWQVLGPLPLQPDRRTTGPVEREPFRIDLQVEGVKGAVTWRECRSDGDCIQINRWLNHGDRASCYLASWVYSPVERRVQVSVGSDDGCCVWLNRERLLERRLARSAAPNQDRAGGVLTPGWNEVLVHLDNSGGGEWALYLEFRTEQGDQPLRVHSQSTPPIDRRRATRRASNRDSN